MLKFPYGISNFYRIQTNHYFYVDRSHHIRLLEEAGDQLLFLRPRRFGKSLLLSMLENYYDVAKAEEFDKLFGNLAIGQNPTEKHNQYFVMKWDFSMVRMSGNLTEIDQALHDYINGCIEQFQIYYQNRLNYQLTVDKNNAIRSFQSVLAAVSQTPYQLYLLIDEYDNFANEVLMGRGETDPKYYNALLSAESSLKSFFRTVKSACSGQGLERVFITGATPVLMSDMTTAYNVAENIYLQPAFNELCGFRESELASVVNQIVEECQLPPEKGQMALNLMQMFYNAYCFSERASEGVYNPTLALYFLKHFQQDCQFPRQMLDSNLKLDLNKLSYLSRLPNGRAIIQQALEGSPPLAISFVADRFGIDDMLKETQSNQFIITLLYYLGVLTLDGETELKKLRFKIPNLVVRKLYVEHLLGNLLPKEVEREKASLLAEDFYQTGDLQPICDLMTQRYFKVFDNRDYKTADELTIKTAFLTVLFDDAWYIMDSETALERRYADLTMILRPDYRHLPLRNFLFEFKYLKFSDVKKSGAELKELSLSELEALEAVKGKLAESEKQLLDYQTRLESKYSDGLKLQLISVVAIGFERVVWKTVSRDLD